MSSLSSESESSELSGPNEPSPAVLRMVRTLGHISLLLTLAVLVVLGIKSSRETWDQRHRMEVAERAQVLVEESARARRYRADGAQDGRDALPDHEEALQRMLARMGGGKTAGERPARGPSAYSGRSWHESLAAISGRLEPRTGLEGGRDRAIPNLVEAWSGVRPSTPEERYAALPWHAALVSMAAGHLPATLSATPLQKKPPPYHLAWQVVLAHIGGGRAASAGLGIELGFGFVFLFFIFFMCDIITMLYIYPLFVSGFQRISHWRIIGPMLKKTHDLAHKHKARIEPYGPIGLLSFVLFPFWSTGPLVGVVVGYLIGLRTWITFTASAGANFSSARSLPIFSLAFSSASFFAAAAHSSAAALCTTAVTPTPRQMVSAVTASHFHTSRIPVPPSVGFWPTPVTSRTARPSCASSSRSVLSV